jgi:ATP-dependent RNA circularization protein (DNA/RNA ligase family)
MDPKIGQRWIFNDGDDYIFISEVLGRNSSYYSYMPGQDKA